MSKKTNIAAAAQGAAAAIDNNNNNSAAEIINHLTREAFAFPVLPGRYTCEKGGVLVEFTVTDAGHNSGRQKCYSSAELGIEAKPISAFKKYFDAVVYHRDGTGAGAGAGRVLTDDEIAAKVSKYAVSLRGKFDSLCAALAAADYTATVAVNPAMTGAEISDILYPAREAYLAKLTAANDARRAEAEAAAAAAAERAEKRAAAESRRSISAAAAADPVKLAIMQAVAAGDWAKVAELSAAAGVAA